MWKRPDLPECLTIAAGLRIPTFRREPAEGAESPAERVRQMEEYIQITGHWEGELEEERLRWLSDREPLKREWDHLTGWEELKRTKTETAVTQAKRQVAPELYDNLQDNEWMVKRLTEQIARMGRDYDRASRIYTLVMGS